MKIHFFKSRPNAFGGFNTSTMCGRSHSESKDGFNSTDDPAKVTCKECRRLMPIRPLFTFEDYQDWVDSATGRFRMHAVSSANTYCLDYRNRLCEIGKDFMRARDEGTFPIKVYAGKRRSKQHCEGQKP